MLLNFDFNISFCDMETWTDFVCDAPHFMRQEVTNINSFTEHWKEDPVGGHGICDSQSYFEQLLGSSSARDRAKVVHSMGALALFSSTGALHSGNKDVSVGGTDVVGFFTLRSLSLEC